MGTSSDRKQGNEHPAGAQSFARTMQLLRMVTANGRDGLRLVDATRQSGLTRSTAHRLMQALEHEGLVEQDPVTERYFPGIETYILGLAAEERFGIVDASLPFVAKLADLSGDTCLLHIRRGDVAACVAREEGRFPIRTHMAFPGDRRPLGVGAGGLAILSTLEDEEIQRFSDRKAAALQAEYQISPDMLIESVKETRLRGFAVNPGRVFPESWAIAVPLIDGYGRCRASLTLAGIESRISHPRSDELAAMLSQVAAECVAEWKGHTPRSAIV